jgi:hypothetical protein
MKKSVINEKALNLRELLKEWKEITKKKKKGK